MPVNFSVDSGADYTTLFLAMLTRIDTELDKSRPEKFKGMGKHEGSGYIANIKLQITNNPIDVHCTFMDDEATRPILGKVDIFERYNILFDNKNRRIKFREI